MNEDDFAMVVQALGDLKEKIFFVGASINVFLVDAPAKPTIRETIDIDAVGKAATYGDFHDLECGLQAKGFRPSDVAGDPACRWYFEKIQFDLIPLVPLGPHVSNPWYQLALEHVEDAVTRDGNTIKILSPPFFIATKLDAFNSRGDLENLLTLDPEINHDLEDIVLLLDGRRQILDTIENAPSEVRKYIKSEFKMLASHPQILDFISNCLDGSGRADRVTRVLDLLKNN